MKELELIEEELVNKRKKYEGIIEEENNKILK